MCVCACIIMMHVMLLDSIAAIITDESDVYFDHFIVTVAPHYEVTMTNKRCGCNSWSRTVPRVS